MIKLTYEFKDRAELMAHLNALDGFSLTLKGPLTQAAEQEQGRGTTTEAAKAREIPGVKSVSGAIPLSAAAAEAALAAASPSPEAAPSNGTAAPAEAASSEPSYNDVKAAFRAYVERPGLTAATAMEKILAPMGLPNTRAAKPEQYRALINAFNSAVPDTMVSSGAAA